MLTAWCVAIPLRRNGLFPGVVPDSLLRPADTVYHKPFLDDVISGKNEDSLVYQVQKKIVYIYEKGDVKYQKMNLKADFMRINMDNKEIYAYGRPDTVQLKEPTEAGDTVKITATRPEFLDNGTSYTMDTITYNLDSKKARIKGVATQEGRDTSRGMKVKKMPDNTINIANGRYTTCDAEDPHFYMAMTKSKTIPGKKSVFGPSYLVMEDVPIYFLRLPFGFFPMSNERKSGFYHSILWRGSRQRIFPSRRGILPVVQGLCRLGYYRRYLYDGFVGGRYRVSLRQALQISRLV